MKSTRREKKKALRNVRPAWNTSKSQHQEEFFSSNFEVSIHQEGIPTFPSLGPFSDLFNEAPEIPLSHYIK